MDWHLQPRSRITEFDPMQPRIPKGMTGGGRWAKVQAIFDSAVRSENPNAIGRLARTVRAAADNDRLRAASRFKIPEDPDFYEELSRDEVLQLQTMLDKHLSARDVDSDRLSIHPDMAALDMTDAQRQRASKYSGARNLRVLRTPRGVPAGSIAFSWRDGSRYPTSRVAIAPDGSLWHQPDGRGEWSVLEDGPPIDPRYRDERSSSEKISAMFSSSPLDDAIASFSPATRKRVEAIVAFARENGIEIDARNGMIDLHVPHQGPSLYAMPSPEATYYIQKVGKRTVAKRYIPATGEDDVIALDAIIDDMREQLSPPD